MVKKGKKEDKPMATDVFDSLLVETKQASTVVLMLSSPETEIQARSCEAIYKFVSKCDENKKVLLDLDAIDALLELMKSEDKVVHRNALMALGTMCAYSEVRKMLRKRDDSIPSFISLLNPEEETLVLEFASLGLSYMSIEYVSKADIFRNQGLEPLVHCLSNTDPDVQKNSLEAITQLMLNHQCQRSMKDLNGFPPLLELIKSEYAIIQRLTLLALERSSRDIENRMALRDLDVLSKLVDIISHQEWSDLHIMAVMVISNMMEDIESVEKFKEGIGLKKLIALITDQVPPEDDQTKKGDKKGTKSGKKGKESRRNLESRTGSRRLLSSRMGFEDDGYQGDNVAKAGKEEDTTTTPTDSVFPTLPDVKICAANAIARAARNGEIRKILHEQEMEKMLIILLAHENPSVQAAAGHALAVMCENVSCRLSVLEWGGFYPLIRLLHSDNGETLEAATLALQYLTTSNSSNCLEVLKLHGISPLIHVLDDTNDGAVSNAAAVLTNLAHNEAIRKEVWQKGVISALVKALRSTNNKAIQSNVSLALANYVCSPSSREELRNINGVEPLVQLLESEKSDVVRNASWAVFVCAADEATAQEICIHGGLRILQDIHLSTTRCNQFTDAALERLLDNNLSAKYSFRGCLEPINIIGDGFFFAGRLKANAAFKSLEELSSQKLRDRKAIIVVNAKYEPPPKEDEQKHEESDLPSMSRTSKNKRDVRSRGQKDRSEKAQEEDDVYTQDGERVESEMEAEEKIFATPEDPDLVNYIEELSEKVCELTTIHGQVIALAQFVSTKMGGPIAADQVCNFSWELPLSQIQHELSSNVVPIGRIKAGVQTHRALLFKVLADRVLIKCSLVQGEYFKAWNVVLLGNEDITEKKTESHVEHIFLKDESITFPPKAYVVDLIHQPGQLMKADSPEAMAYCRI